jgi:drug/metabolite transporter, DME family
MSPLDPSTIRDPAAPRAAFRCRSHRRQGKLLNSPAVSDHHALERRGLLLIAGAALLWSTGGLGIKAIPDAALKVAFYRSAIAAVALFILFRPRYWRFSAPFCSAVISYGACLTTFVIATRWTTAANAIFLQYSGVIWVLVLSPLVLRESLRWRDAVAISVALAGMALFFVGRLDAGGLSGNIMALLSGVFFAALVLSLRLERGKGAEAAVTWGNVAVALVLLPFVANDLALSTTSFAVLGFLGVFQIAVAYALFVTGLKYVTATQASLTGMIEPIANPIWVFLLLAEVPHPLAIVGGAIVLTAIAWRTVSGRREVKTPIAPPD